MRPATNVFINDLPSIIEGNSKGDIFFECWFLPFLDNDPYGRGLQTQLLAAFRPSFVEPNDTVNFIELRRSLIMGCLFRLVLCLHVSVESSVVLSSSQTAG